MYKKLVLIICLLFGVGSAFAFNIRDIQNQTINNTFGDAVFSLILFNNNPSDEKSVEKSN